MTERYISDDFWSDPMIQSTDTDGKCLYAWCFSNKYQKPHGIMKVTIESIAFDTKIKPAKIEELFVYYGADHIRRWPDKSLIWVKNFIIRQAKNASFLQAALNHLFLDIKDRCILEEYLKYYATVGLWCKYGDNTVSTPSNAVLISNNILCCSVTEDRGDTQEGKGFIGAGDSVWEEVKQALKIKISPANFDTWLGTSVGIGQNGEFYLVGVGSSFQRDNIQKRLKPIVEKELSTVLNKATRVKFVVRGELSNAVKG